MLRIRNRPSCKRALKQFPGSLFLALLIFVSLDLAFSRVIDPNATSPERPILALIASDLDSHGINIVYGRSTDYPLEDAGVRVAPLAGFAPNKRDWGSYLPPTWASAFQKGVFGFIIAVPNRPSAVGAAQESCMKDISDLGLDVCEFVRKWISAAPDQRVFIAFTKEDFERANQVRESLEKAGFTVFVFLKGKDQKPWADPGMVGEVFAQAKFRIVIDTANARGSPGVAIERECCAPLLDSPPPTTALMLALQGKT
jgi:hypothetical protein